MIRARWLVSLLAGLASACAGMRANPAEPDGPYVVVLGTAQDGGLPHIGCDSGNCAAARRDPSRRRLVTSLMLCDPRSGKRWLFDCTPDVREELDRVRGIPAKRFENAAAPRPPPFDGMFLTHAHMGHYGGLLQLGREAYAVMGVPTYVTPRFAGFLRGNDPWKRMVDDGRLVIHELAPGDPGSPSGAAGSARAGGGVSVELAPDLHVDCFRVPHRDEFSDTVGFVIRGPRRSLAYLPDIDKWEKWDAWTWAEAGAGAAAPSPSPSPSQGRRVETLIGAVDYALLDGCFFADGEIPGRSIQDIPHPFIAESVARFAPLPAAERDKVFFTHLNHTNPAADPASDAARAVGNAGMHVLDEEHRFGL
jgi:pyrroloquinoline quinone biosynthesis protein B